MCMHVRVFTGFYIAPPVLIVRLIISEHFWTLCHSIANLPPKCGVPFCGVSDGFYRLISALPSLAVTSICALVSSVVGVAPLPERSIPTKTSTIHHPLIRFLGHWGCQLIPPPTKLLRNAFGLKVRNPFV